MADERRRRAEDLFQQAADLEPDERDAFLQQACASEPGLRAEVERLLRHIDSRAVRSLHTVQVDDPGDRDLTGTTVGPYTLVELLGEGGFGSVYRAEQQHPIRREVALKIIKLGMDTRQVIARFESERQTLAMMEHPNIARVLDAGATAVGRPYFVMELVRGEPLTAYCRGHSLGIRERLELFIPVCRAVQHAHAKGVIHRDIKPSNILVSAPEGTAVPKVIDFGIAKATRAGLRPDTLLTRFHQFVGTPEYMSPEHVSGAWGEPRDIDTRADVYSLGAVLYELLCGVTPFDSQTLRDASPAQLQRILSRQDPIKPSGRVGRNGTGASPRGGGRHPPPRALSRTLSGELDWIVMKALEKDRERRYESVGALAADLRRYLGNQPVLAGPPSSLYQFRKAVARHRTVFGLAAALFVLACGFGGWMALLYARSDRLRQQAHRNLAVARRAEQRARIEAETARRTTDLLIGLFNVAAPGEPSGGELTVRSALDRGAVRIRQDLENEPDVQATLMHTMGRAYMELGLWEEAGGLFRDALTTRRERLGPEHLDTLATMSELGTALLYAGTPAEAERVLAEALTTGRRVLGNEHPQTLGAIDGLAWVLKSLDRVPEAERLARESLATRRRMLGGDAAATIESLNRLSWLLQLQGKYEQAEPLSREAVEASTRTLGDEHLATAESMNMLGVLLTDCREPSAAEPYLRRAAVIRQRVYGGGHPLSLESVANLAEALLRQEKAAEAERCCRRALEACPGVAPPTRQQACCRILLGEALVMQGKHAQAVPPLEEALAAAREHGGQPGSNALWCRALLGNALLGAGRGEEGDRHLEAARSGLCRQLAADPDGDDYSVALWTRLLFEPGSFGEGHPLVGEVLSHLRTALGPDHQLTLRLTASLAAALEQRARPAVAEQHWREYLARSRTVLPGDSWVVAVAGSHLGGCLLAQGRFADAEALLVGSHPVLCASRGAEGRDARRNLAWLVALYEAWDRPDDAAAWRATARPRRDPDHPESRPGRSRTP